MFLFEVEHGGTFIPTTPEFNAVFLDEFDCKFKLKPYKFHIVS